MPQELRRVDYYQLQTTNNHCSVLVAPSTKSPSRKLVVADHSNDVYSFEYTDTLKISQFPVTTHIARIYNDQRRGKETSRILITQGTCIFIYSVNGKQLFKYGSSIDGTITALASVDSGLYFVTECIYQKLVSWKEDEFLLCPDRISDILVLHDVFPDSTPLVVLACIDRMIRLLKCGTINGELEVAGPPTCLSTADAQRRADHVVYGTSDGQLGLIKLMRGQPVHGWQLCSRNTRGPVLGIEHFDLFHTGQEQLIVSYEEGVIEVYEYDTLGHPCMLYDLNLLHKLTSVKAGTFASPQYPELVCVAYTGAVFGLTTEPLKEVTEQGQEEVGRSLLQSKVDKLREEVSVLEEQLLQIRSTREKPTDQSMLCLTTAKIAHNFSLDASRSIFCLHLECAVALDHVLIQCDCPVELEDSEHGTAILSLTPCTVESGSALLATLRYQANVNFTKIYLRTIEGQYGTLRVYVTPSSIVSVTCQCLEFPIRPLSLHQRIHSFEDGRPLSRLTLTGRFSLATIHQWVRLCVPETPEKPPFIEPSTEGSVPFGIDPGEQYVRLIYGSTFLPTQLECCYQRNKATFRSCNISTLAIVKDFLTKEATMSKVQLSIDTDIHPDSVEHTLRLIHPELEAHITLARQVRLIDPIQELVAGQTQSFPQPFCGDNAENPLPGSLPEEHAAIWRDSARLRTLYKQQPIQLERLSGCVVDQYIDKFRFQGIDVKSRITELMKLLNQYDFYQILQFFNES
ncbi:hypothetical protein CRM22_005147 [Opisthorchis felineus]|uniref:Bardet-Biedl syndrome 7 protein homolog n=1 Tax=Opisthorchis felineus TaxID=147828 RepID=A0A4S2LY70_OPIFE|nr:hypothetical protein CRM22_005147 [Opisthorchis felineus]